MARFLYFAAFVLVACSRPQPSPAPAASAAPKVDVAIADASPQAAERDAASSVDAGNTTDAAPPSKVKPHVRAKKWVCDEQQCEGWSTFAYDYLPAVTTDGAIAAVVEERDGWGHVPDPGVRFVDTRDGSSLELHALAQGKRDLGTYEAFAKRKSELEGIVAKANAALDAKSWVTLLPAGEPLTFMDAVPGSGKWVKIDAEDGKCANCTFESRWSVGGITVALVTSSPSFGDGVAPKSVIGAKVTVDGKVVFEKNNGRAVMWPVKTGCSDRKLVLLGVRRDPNIAILRETHGSTTHACDGKREPQEVRTLRW